MYGHLLKAVSFLHLHLYMRCKKLHEYVSKIAPSHVIFSAIESVPKRKSLNVISQKRKAVPYIFNSRSQLEWCQHHLETSSFIPKVIQQLRKNFCCFFCWVPLLLTAFFKFFSSSEHEKKTKEKLFRKETFMDQNLVLAFVNLRIFENTKKQCFPSISLVSLVSGEHFILVWHCVNVLLQILASRGRRCKVTLQKISHKYLGSNKL